MPDWSRRERSGFCGPCVRGSDFYFFLSQGRAAPVRCGGSGAAFAASVAARFHHCQPLFYPVCGRAAFFRSHCASGFSGVSGDGTAWSRLPSYNPARPSLPAASSADCGRCPWNARPGGGCGDEAQRSSARDPYDGTFYAGGGGLLCPFLHLQSGGPGCGRTGRAAGSCGGCRNPLLSACRAVCSRCDGSEHSAPSAVCCSVSGRILCFRCGRRAAFSENFCRVDPEKRGKTFSNGRSAYESGLEGGILSGASPVFFLSHLCFQYPCDLCADAGLRGSAYGDGKRKNRRSDAAA